MRSTLLWLTVLFAGALIVLYVAQRQLTGVFSAVGVRPETEEALRRSLDDQKRLARLDPAHRAEYRARFDELEALHRRLEILRLTQRDIVRQYEAFIFGIVAATLGAATMLHLFRRRREHQRLMRVGMFLRRLSLGEPRLRVGESGSDAIARIAAMIETTSDVMAADRERLRTLENLAGWQEAARRHAHEIRTPLTAAQMELDSLCRELQMKHPELRGEIEARRQSIQEELDRLREFTRNFTAFAALPEPKMEAADLGKSLHEFAETFATAWRTELIVDTVEAAVAAFDRTLLRQVLVNLCGNAAAAGARRLNLSLQRTDREALIDVRDDGGGVSATVRERLFEPYVTTRRVGEGMGLGLAISKKIMLDQHGDLQLVASTSEGTTFRVSLPLSPEAQR